MAFHEDNKQQCQQFLLLNATYIVFVFKIFIDMDFVTQRLRSQSHLITDFVIVILVFIYLHGLKMTMQALQTSSCISL
jgi:Ca2+/H+ antiporter